uniref:Uncharacterized protein n=2 Tax=viral metagenome TaxID=1070528 RepID=A0A6M3IZR9_9ZZZZ
MLSLLTGVSFAEDMVRNPATGELDIVFDKADEIDIDDTGDYFTGTDVETALQEIGSDISTIPPLTADYLVGTLNTSLSAEIVVGTTPGGQLGGTWASPTIDDLFLKNDASDTMDGNLTLTGTDPAYYLDPTVGDTWHIYTGAESYLAFSNYTHAIEVLTLTNDNNAIFYGGVQAAGLNIIGEGSFSGNLTVSGTINISGATTISGLTYPTTDGTNGQTIVTNGSGTLSFSSAGSGDLKADGTVPLTADWNAGNSLYDITAVEFKGALVGNATTATDTASKTGTGSIYVTNTSPTLVTPALGTPSALVGTNISGTGASFTAGAVTNATFTTALIVDTGAVTLTGNVGASVLTLGAGASSISGANTGDNTVATSGDAALDFFGAGVTAVTDATACTDIEGTGLSIAGGILGITADSIDGASLTDNILVDTLTIGDGVPTNYTGISATGAITQGGSATLTLQDGSDLIITANPNAAQFLANNGDTGTGVFDFGGASDFEIENGANPTVDTAGEISVDTSALPGSGVRFYGDAAYTLSGTYSKSFCLLNPVATDDYPIWKAPYAITIRAVHVQCLGGTNIIGQLTECDAEGINPAVVDSADITATANNSVDDDGALSNASIDALDYVGWATTSISGTPTSVTVTFEYTIDAVN